MPCYRTLSHFLTHAITAGERVNGLDPEAI